MSSAPSGWKSWMRESSNSWGLLEQSDGDTLSFDSHQRAEGLPLAPRTSSMTASHDSSIAESKSGIGDGGFCEIKRTSPCGVWS